MADGGGGKRVKFTQEGSVVRITMKNFMTYKHETIFPGPNFNVTVGPNGSGKSSIVTALSICLGGDIKSLNRQADLQSLINNECGNKAAIVEVELFNAKENIVVKSMLTKDANEPKWFINNKAVSKDKLLRLTEKLQIQPGNLCQFLPQDVVREFPQMKPSEIFENTIKAVGDLEMLNKLYKGGEIQDAIERLNSNLKTKKNTVTSNEAREQKLEGDRIILEQIEELEERQSVIEKSLCWEKFKVLRKTVKETRTQKEQLGTRNTTISAELDPIQEFLKKYIEKIAEQKAEVEKVEAQLKKNGNKVESFEIYQLEDELDRQAEREKDLTLDEHNRIQQKENITKDIEELTEYLRTNVPDPGLEENYKKLRDKKMSREDQLNNKEIAKQEIETHISLAKKEVEKLTRTKNSLFSRKNRKETVLEKENPDTYAGVIWLRSNQNKFKARVHEPLMLCLDVKDPAHARYVETHVGRADLEGFVCEDPDDVNLLLKELREKNKLRRINAFHSYPTPKERFKKPLPEAGLSEFGFVSYLSDMYDAPLAVNAYLCQQKNLHQVPLFREENERTDELKQKFHSYYIGKFKFTTKRSKYSKELSTGIEDIGSRKVIRLADSIDKTRLEEVEKELTEKQKMLRNHEARLKSQDDTILKLKEVVREISEETRKIEMIKKNFNNKKAELTYKEEMLKSLQKPKVNVEEEKQKIAAKKSELVLELVGQVAGLVEFTKSCNELDLRRRSILLQIQNVEAENQESTDREKELLRDQAAVTEQLNKVNKKFEEEKKQLYACHKDAENATGGVLDPKQKYKPPEMWQRKFAALGTNDINVLTVMIEDCENDIKKKKVSPDTIRKIKEIKETLEKARAEVDDIEASLKQKTEELEQLRRGWISGVKRMVDQVGDKFSGMMAKLSYAGQVELSEGLNGDPLDLKNYGIKIYVKFRSDEDFNELSKGTQSGGEKSVTTAVYMMALQGLTQVPFRCVDEINQGMDEKNERRVWGMLLEVCRDHHAQYFYMAPKFPYSLPFDHQVTIMLCNSGSTVKQSHSDFTTKDFVKASRNL